MEGDFNASAAFDRPPPAYVDATNGENVQSQSGSDPDNINTINCEHYTRQGVELATNKESFQLSGDGRNKQSALGQHSQTSITPSPEVCIVISQELHENPQNSNEPGGTRGGTQGDICRNLEESQHQDITCSREIGNPTPGSPRVRENEAPPAYESIFQYLQPSYLRRNLNLFNRTSSVRRGHQEARESTEVEANRAQVVHYEVSNEGAVIEEPQTTGNVPAGENAAVTNGNEGEEEETADGWAICIGITACIFCCLPIKIIVLILCCCAWCFED